VNGEKHRLGVPIFFQVFMIYSAVFAVASSAVAFAITVDAAPDFLRVMLFIFGLFMALGAWFVGRREIDAHQTLFDCQIEYDQAVIDASRPKPPKPVYQEVNLVYRDTADDVIRNHVHSVDTSELPPRDFIIECHAGAMKDEFLHAPEAKMMVKWGTAAKVYLRTLEGMGILTRADARKSGARVWNMDFDAARVCRAFGYDEPTTPLLSASVAISPNHA